MFFSSFVNIQLRLRGAKGCKSDRFRSKEFPMIFWGNIAFDTAENEPRKYWITDFADHFFRSHIERIVESVLQISPKEFSKTSHRFGLKKANDKDNIGVRSLCRW